MCWQTYKNLIELRILYQFYFASTFKTFIHIVQQAETRDLKSLQYEFKSHYGYQLKGVSSVW